ncbi:MAG: NADH-quinone oxidoreductase subunit A [Gammaproteobacteria bacterium]|nr:NADH-quinone oxidoreductase subunit A [Gammaproteobacteria bacterium]
MLENYLPILIFMALAVGIPVLLIGLGALISPHHPDAEKVSQYECGFEPFEDSRMKFDVRFYLIAILFIIFDLEVAFLFPWAVVLSKMAWAGVIAMGIFLGLLLVGFLYEWKKGALEWE